MFGDDDEYWVKLAESLLELFSLEEILDMNDLTSVKVVARLIELGLINTLDDFSRG